MSDGLDERVDDVRTSELNSAASISEPIADDPHDIRHDGEIVRSRLTIDAYTSRDPGHLLDADANSPINSVRTAISNTQLFLTGLAYSDLAGRAHVEKLLAELEERLSMLLRPVI